MTGAASRPQVEELSREAIGKAGVTDVCKAGMDEAASVLEVEGEDCYDLGTRCTEAIEAPDLKMTRGRR